MKAKFASIEIVYICPMCFAETATLDPFPKHCGHYMVDFGDFLQDPEGWLVAREYELSKQVR